MLPRKFWAAVAGALVVFAAPFIGVPPAWGAAPPPPNRAEGTWIYMLGVSPYGGAVGFLTLQKGAKGGLKATFEDPQSRRTQNFFFVAVKRRNVQILEYGITPIFDANLSADGATLDGKLMAGGAWRALKLYRFKGRRPMFPRPQEPKKPLPYAEEEVAFAAGTDGVRLAGTLALPRGKGPHPAVVLISGSAPVDRNSSASGHLPFLVLADHLARRGLAVLRFDSRGVGKSAGKPGLANTEERVRDIDGALAFLRKRKDIAPNRVGLIGHSEGASVAALTAARDRDVAWIVLLGGPGLPGDRVMVRQAEMGWKALKPLGIKPALIDFQIALQKQAAEALKRTPTPDGADKALREVIAAAQARLTKEDLKRMGVPANFRVGTVGSGPWLHRFVSYDPRAALRKVGCPVLALNGDKDLLVWSKENLPEIEKALRDGGNRDFTVKELPGLNHMFQTSDTGRPLDYVMIDETIAPSVLKLVGDWVDSRKGPKPAPRSE